MPKHFLLRTSTHTNTNALLSTAQPLFKVADRYPLGKLKKTLFPLFLLFRFQTLYVRVTSTNGEGAEKPTTTKAFLPK